MILIGATAIKDSLQKEVGNTVAALNQANIKFWMLTGDKSEIATDVAI